MKRFILQNLFLVSFLIIAGLTYSANAECPPERDPVTGQYGGPWEEITEKFNYTGYIGCNATVVYKYCRRINEETGLHEVAISDIKICSDCDPEKLYDSTFTSSLLINLVSSQSALRWLGLDELPFCPDGGCVLKIYDQICYSRWIRDVDGCWIMEKCDDGILRSCNETVVVCIDAITKLPTVYRSGYSTGPRCPDGCRSNCNF